MPHLWSLLLLATVQYGQTSGDVAKLKLCMDNNLTLSLSQVAQLRRAIVTSDQFPAFAKATCSIRINFDAAATVNLTLSSANIWKKLIPSTGAQGYVLEITNGHKKFVYSKSIPEGSTAWTNTTSEPCPYLYVGRASTPNSGDAIQSILNGFTTFNTKSVVIELSVPETAWCNIRINIDASPTPEDYCKAKEELYCETSVQCLNASLRCDGHLDCDNGEDELNCSADGFTEGLMAEGTAVITYAGLSVGIGVVISFIITVVVFLRRRRLKKSRRKENSYDYSNNRQTRTTLIDNEMYSPSPQCSASSNVSAVEPVYYVLEAQRDQTSTSSIKSSE